jgi:hypothetical protein
MLAAVEFDCELRAPTGEVDDERCFDALASEGWPVA